MLFHAKRVDRLKQPPGVSHRPARIRQASQQRGATQRPSGDVFVNGGIFERELTGRRGEFLSTQLKDFGPHKALYLSAIGLLGAQHASSAPLLGPVPGGTGDTEI